MKKWNLGNDFAIRKRGHNNNKPATKREIRRSHSFSGAQIGSLGRKGRFGVFFFVRDDYATVAKYLEGDTGSKPTEFCPRLNDKPATKHEIGERNQIPFLGQEIGSLVKKGDNYATDAESFEGDTGSEFCTLCARSADGERGRLDVRRRGRQLAGVRGVDIGRRAAFKPLGRNDLLPLERGISLPDWYHLNCGSQGHCLFRFERPVFKN